MLIGDPNCEVWLESLTEHQKRERECSCWRSKVGGGAHSRAGNSGSQSQMLSTAGREAANIFWGSTSALEPPTAPRLLHPQLQLAKSAIDLRRLFAWRSFRLGCAGQLPSYLAQRLSAVSASKHRSSPFHPQRSSGLPVPQQPLECIPPLQSLASSPKATRKPRTQKLSRPLAPKRNHGFPSRTPSR